jgi:hypothetical protein
MISKQDKQEFVRWMGGVLLALGAVALVMAVAGGIGAGVITMGEMAGATAGMLQ